MFGQLTIMLGLLCAIESTVQLLLPSYYHCSMIEVEGKALWYLDVKSRTFSHAMVALWMMRSIIGRDETGNRIHQ